MTEQIRKMLRRKLAKYTVFRVLERKANIYSNS